MQKKKGNKRRVAIVLAEEEYITLKLLLSGMELALWWLGETSGNKFVKSAAKVFTELNSKMMELDNAYD